MKKLIVTALIIISAALLILACGSGGGGTSSTSSGDGGTNNDGGSTGGNGGGSGSGGTVSKNVRLFFTDDISDYRNVIATVKKVSIKHTGSGRECEVLTDPLEVDIPTLSNVLQLVAEAGCEEASYNRIYMEFEPTATLTNNLGTTAECNLVSFKNGNAKNSLSCSGNTCSMEITGAVNVLMTQTSDLTLDFDLKEFEVTPEPLVAGQACEVTMKVSPINASGGNSGGGGGNSGGGNGGGGNSGGNNGGGNGNSNR